MVAIIGLAASSMTALPASAQPQGISTSFLTGVWKENPQCRGADSMVFLADGTMSSAGSIATNYTVVGGNQILVYGPGGQQSFGAQYIDQNKFVFTLNNASTVMYRCTNVSNSGSSPQNPNSRNSLAPTPVTFAGGWGENGNCAKADVFTAGGHFRAANGSGGTWSLFGNTLRMTLQNGATIDAQIQNFNNTNMALNIAGQTAYYRRCF